MAQFGIEHLTEMLKEKVTIYFYEEMEEITRKLVSASNGDLAKCRSEMNLWKDAIQSFTTPHQMLLFIKRRASHQQWLLQVSEAFLDLMDKKVKFYIDNQDYPIKDDEAEYYKILVKVQLILIHQINIVLFGLKEVSGK